MSNPLELLVRAFVAEAQELDAASTALLPATSLDEATGVQLDGLGQIIGPARQGLDDDQYRALLKAYVLINKSGTEIETINDIVLLLTDTEPGDQAFELHEGSPAEFIVTMNQILPAGFGPVIAEAIYRAKAAGVHGVFSYWETEPVFAFDGDGGSQFDGGYYLRSATRNIGGRESEIL